MFNALTPGVAGAAMPACDPINNGNQFVGNTRFSLGIRGVSADIEWFNSSLCTQTGPSQPSWSLSWVALDSGGDDPDVPGVDIYQGGFAKCAVPGAPSCAWNSGISYHWYYYGRQEGVCGPFVSSGVIKAPKGNAGPGRYTYDISKQTSGSYRFSIDGDAQYSKADWTLETCWLGGIERANWLNEMLDPNDQNGGTVAIHQVFDNLQYLNSSGWHDHTRPTSSSCQYNDQPVNWRCNFGSRNGNQFYSWDMRVP